MSIRIIGLIATCLTTMILAGCAPAVQQKQQDTHMRFGTISVYSTSYAPRGVVFLFSDRDGWTSQMAETAEHLAITGVIVLGIDLSTYEANLRASDDGCHYLISEVEELSKQIQREYGFSRYRTPLLTGVGEGGALAYAALAQSPYVTVAGAAAINPANILHTKVPLCPGAVSHQAEDGFSYDSRADLPGISKFSYTNEQAVASVPAWAAVTDAQPVSRWQHWLYGDDMQILLRPLLASINNDPAGLDDLPITAIPSATAGDTLAIILSGDGGWRDIDRTIGETLARGNIAVVGLDTLRYFWEARSPQQVANDLTRIMNAYGKLWNRQRILLVGYSFGADVLPAAYNLLPNDTRQRIGQISLLGMSETADFQFHVEGWLGMESGGSSKTVPELARIPDRSILQCLYGDDDDEQICTDPVFNAAHRVKLAGGHHFEGAYEKLADVIAAQWNKQAIQP